MQLPGAFLQASNDAGGLPLARVVALTDKAGALGCADPVLHIAGFAVTRAGSLTDLLQMARSGAVDVVLADPELGDGWSVDVADRLARELHAAAPVVLVCRTRVDAETIEARIARPGVHVLLDEHLTPDGLGQTLTGAIATYRARPRFSG